MQHLHETETLIALVADYRDRARRNSQAREAAEKRAEEAEKKAAELELHKKELLLRVGAAEDEAKLLTMVLDEEKATHSLARSELRGAEARLAEARSLLTTREQTIKEVELKIKELQAQLGAQEEEAQRRAVQVFRESEEFRELLEEEAVNGLVQGFTDFRNQLRRLCPDFDLDQLQPGAGVEGLEGESAEAASEVPGGEATYSVLETAPEGDEVGEPEATAERVEAEGAEIEPGEIPAEDAAL